MQGNPWFAPVLLSAAALTSACTFTHRLELEPKLAGLPAVEPLSATAAIYYSPPFAREERTRTMGANVFTAAIGPASVRLFDALLPKAFTKTVRVSSPNLRRSEADVLVVPAIEHFDFRLGTDSDSERYSVGYRTTLYSPGGVPVASWAVLGNRPGTWSSNVWSWIEGDMEDAAAKMLERFQREAPAALQAIQRHERGESMPLDSGAAVLTARRAQIPALPADQAAALAQAGVVALTVEARNRSSRPLLVRASDMRLRLADGRLVEPITVSATLRLLEKPSQAGGAVAAAIGGPFGVLVDVMSARQTESERAAQFSAESAQRFGDRSLGGNELATGLVLFRLPASSMLASARLVAWFVDPLSADGLQAEARPEASSP